jgi:hypothetical protein
MFRTFTQAAEFNQTRGAYPSTYWQFVHVHKNASESGLAAAFARVGGRNVVDLDRLDALLAAQGAPPVIEQPSGRGKSRVAP